MAGTDDLVLHVDGSRPVSPAVVEELLSICDRAEDGYGAGLLTVYVSRAPLPGWTQGLSVGLLTKWERAVRRLERLGLVTVAVAAGDCGGTALDVLLATDVRIAIAGTRLVVPSGGDATWPGMALYRFARQGGGAGLRRAALLGTPITAEQAAAAGLVDVVVEQADQVHAEIAAAAGTVTGSEVAIRRQLLLDAGDRSYEEALGSHLAACDRALRRQATP
ncbi:enoyl-CoA-hydratase DpgB [Actinoplanes sp. NPDC024001]|uniref:enoyl-CoA-hydratase DpgB n=1 Tax=Actinoplanes sp. NPDC024001 TaxID=3154598 RepID=UPI0033D1DA57